MKLPLRPAYLLLFIFSLALFQATLVGHIDWPHNDYTRYSQIASESCAFLLNSNSCNNIIDAFNLNASILEVKDHSWSISDPQVFQDAPLSSALFSVFSLLIVGLNMVAPPFFWFFTVNVLSLYIFFLVKNVINIIFSPASPLVFALALAISSPLIALAFFPPLKEVWSVFLSLFLLTTVNKIKSSTRDRFSHVVLCVLAALILLSLRQYMFAITCLSCFVTLLNATPRHKYAYRTFLSLFIIGLLIFLCLTFDLPSLLSAIAYLPLSLDFSTAYNSLDSALRLSYSLSHIIAFTILTYRSLRSTRPFLSLFFWCFSTILALYYIKTDAPTGSLLMSFTFVRIRFQVDLLFLVFSSICDARSESSFRSVFGEYI